MKVTREDLQAIEIRMGSIPAIAGMYAPVLLAWCRALLDEETDTGAPCDGHRHCCADRRRLADELLRVRAERDALRSSLDRKIRHCDEITEERDALREIHAPSK